MQQVVVRKVRGQKKASGYIENVSADFSRSGSPRPVGSSPKRPVVLGRPGAWMSEREGRSHIPIYPHLTVWPAFRAGDLAGRRGLVLPCRGRDLRGSHDVESLGLRDFRVGLACQPVCEAVLCPSVGTCAINAGNQRCSVPVHPIRSLGNSVPSPPPFHPVFSRCSAHHPWMLCGLWTVEGLWGVDCGTGNLRAVACLA
jgi:hypothetical protein